MFHFENVGFSNSISDINNIINNSNINNNNNNNNNNNSNDISINNSKMIKYLCCADCELGPIGWCTQEVYICIYLYMYIYMCVCM